MIAGIVVALPEELSTLTSKKINKGQCVFIAEKLLVAYSGAGADNAQSASDLLVAKGATRLISWGCAAALSPLLRPGDLTLADRFIDSDYISIDVNADWHNHSKNLLSQSFSVHSGCLTESKGIVSSSKDKNKLHLITGAIALDMESIAIAKVARQNALPFLAIRVIVDPVNMNLPNSINYSLNEQGGIVMSKLLLFLALHPVELIGLIKLGLHFKKARNTLKMVAKQLDKLSCFDQPNATA
ncbi:MAG: phosphorylase family protein [Methylococcaceae bacterium]